MIFGKIDYLNLLPFHVFMKRFVKTSSEKLGIEYKKNVPAKINREFLSKRVDAAFISSIKAQKSLHIGLGIIARQKVKSVLIIPNTGIKKDIESATSNILANVLQLQGEVLIGDKALRYALKNNNYIDLADVWNKKYHLPFVFALLCYNKDKSIYKRVEREFLRTEVKIPQYILKQASLRTGISQKDILEYLKLISYRVDYKAKLALKKFYKEAKRV